MKGSVTGKVVDWANGETMDQMLDQFSPMDYTVFAILLVISSAIGIYFAWKDRQNDDENNYALAGQTFSAWPVSLSLTATSISAITMMGMPSEYYTFGSTVAWGLIAEFIGCGFAAWIYVPIYYNLGITSINEYLDLRFGKLARTVMAIIGLIQAIVYNGLVVYGPALAMSQCAGLDLNVSILLVGLTCIFYTVIGGMKAVIWTDVWQTLWMISGFVAILIVTSMDFGGLTEILKIANDGGRFPNQFEFDPRYRHTFWSVIFGNSTGFAVASYTCQQYKVQRYLSCKSLKEAQKCIYMAAFGIMAICVAGQLVGYCCFAYFQYCDPWQNGWIAARDQIVPYLSLYMFSDVGPGIAGVYLSAVFGASLSTCSSTINSFSVIVVEDILKPYFKIGKHTISWVSKASMGFSGALIIAFAYMFRNFGGIAEACTAVLSVIGGPTMGLFTLGVFVPFVSQVPALIGICFGILISIWKYVGAFYNPPGAKWTRPLTLDTSMCTNATTEKLPASGIFDDFDYERTAVNDFYHISYTYLGTIGLSTTLLIGLISALLLNKHQTGKYFTPKYLPPKGSTWNTRIKDKSTEYAFGEKSGHL